MTKPGNSGSEEPTQAEAPEATPADPAGATAETPTSSTPDPHESPTGAAGGPPISSLASGTDSSGPSEAEREGVHPPTPSESPIDAPGGPPDSTLPEGTDNSGSDGAAAEPEPAAAESAAAQPAKENLADKKAAEAKAAEEAEKAKPRRTTRAADVEKAPPLPREEALRAQAKRRFEEPAPRTLRFSFYFFTAAGAIWLLSMIASLIYRQDIIDSEIKRNKDPKITPEQITGAVNQILWIVTIAALAFTVFLALFGYKATQGTRRARTLVTIFAAILVVFHLLLNGTQLGILSAMFALVGLALLWSPSSRKYFPPRQVP